MVIVKNAPFQIAQNAFSIKVIMEKLNVKHAMKGIIKIQRVNVQNVMKFQFMEDNVKFVQIMILTMNIAIAMEDILK